MTRRVRLRSEVIQDLMARRNYSQNGLARLVRISSGYISQIIRGRRFPSPEVRRRLMEALGIEDFDALFAMEGMDEEPAQRMRPNHEATR
jgi:transcriptional regulator with XRE-family HTH domain